MSNEYIYVVASGRSAFPEATAVETVYPVHVASLNATSHRDVAMYVAEATGSYLHYRRMATPQEITDFIQAK